MQDISQSSQSTVKKRPRYLLIFLVVAGIVGFLSMFSMCASGDYTKRTYVSEGMALSATAKAASAEFYEKEKRFPKDNKEAGLLAPNQITGQAVKAIEILPQGKIKIIYNNKLADNAFVVLTAVFDQQDKITWRCHRIERLEMKMLPANCREHVRMDRESSTLDIIH